MNSYDTLKCLFTSKIRIKLLDIFLRTSGGRFYVRELGRVLGEEAKNVSRELKNLEALGLLKSQIQGNLKFYSVDEYFLLYPELRSIISKTTGLSW